MVFRKNPRKPLRKQKAKARVVKSKSLASLSRKVNQLARASKQTETKEIVLTNGITTTWLGQIVYNSANFFALDVTPLPSQGVTDVSRIGSQITCKSASYRFQLIAQASAVTPSSVKILLVRVKGPSITAGTLVNQMFNPNPFIYTSSFINAGIVDYNSDLDPDYAKNYQILKTKHIKIPMENYNTGKQIIDVKFNHRFKNHSVMFDGNTNSVQNGQLVLIMLSSAGNSSGSLSTLGGVGIQEANTAYTMAYNIRTLYTDA